MAVNGKTSWAIEYRKRRYQERQRDKRIRRDQVLGKSVELNGLMQAWYSWRESSVIDIGNVDEMTRRFREQERFRDLFTFEDGMRWADWWRFPLELSRRSIAIYAFINDITVRQMWDVVRERSSPELREGNCRECVLIRWLAENAGEIHFPEEF